MDYNSQATFPAFSSDPVQIQKDIEKRKLKERCNLVGFMIIIATLVFLAFSFSISYILTLVASMYRDSTTVLFDKSNDSLITNIMTGFCNIAAIGICGAIFVRYLKKDSSDTLTFEKVGIKKLLALCVIGFTICNLSNYLTIMFMDSAFSFGINLNLESFTYDSNSPVEIIVYILSVAVVPAFSEEILFRGVILSALRKYGDAFAVFVSAFFFGLFHGNFIQFPFAFIIGLVQAWTVVYTNSMLPAIIIHFMNNGFSVVCDVFYANATSWGLTEEIVSIISIAVVIIAAMLALVALIKLSEKDKNFLKLKPYEGNLDKKNIRNTLLTSPAIITAFALLLFETVAVHANLM